MPNTIKTSKFNSIKRVQLQEKTPLLPLRKLGDQLGGINLYVKRDDIGAIGGGGNKLRKLEFIVANALEQGCDTLITFGALQSNHARLTAAVAAKLGMQCHLILNRKVPRQSTHYNEGGNLVLNSLFGAHLHILGPNEDPLAYSAHLEANLAARNNKSYVIPFGGSDALGALGYMECMHELIQQAEEKSIKIDHVIHASGSGGTQAGLVLGAHIKKATFNVIGVSVLHPQKTLENIVKTIIKNTCDLISLEAEQCMDDLNFDDRFVGPGYGLMDAPVHEALELAARSEALILDPVYTGKAFASLIDGSRNGYYKKNDTIVFLHTGGLPGLFAYSDELLDISTHALSTFTQDL